MNRYTKLLVPGAILALGLVGVCADIASAELYSNRSALEQAFRNAGWDVEWLPDGSVNLRPAPSLAAAPPDSAGQPPAASGEQEKWERLRAMGWTVEKSADGSTLLYPPGEGEPTEDQPPAQEAAPASAAAPQQTLDDLLRARNWRVERAKDGSLLLYPLVPKEGHGRSSADKVEPCPGVLPAAAKGIDITLPVDEWGEAKLIAQGWVDRYGGAGLAVGKIRKVLRVYVVSIVETEAPFRLRHQIAVNAEDGRTIVLN